MTPEDAGVSEKRDNKRSIRPHLYTTTFSHVWINLSMVSGIDQLGEVAGQQHRKWRKWGAVRASRLRKLGETQRAGLVFVKSTTSDKKHLFDFNKIKKILTENWQAIGSFCFILRNLWCLARSRLRARSCKTLSGVMAAKQYCNPIMSL